MAAHRHPLTLFLLLSLSVMASHAMAQPACPTIEYIEAINQGKVTQTVHIKGNNAVLFIALDPSLSAPEFDYGGRYRDEHFITSIRELRTTLYSAGIDEVVVWRLPYPTMGAAVAFKGGCALSGYGEPDLHKKLMLMYQAYEEITSEGLDAPSVRDAIRELIMATSYASMYKDEMVDVMIENLRPLMKNVSSPKDDGDDSYEFW